MASSHYVEAETPRGDEPGTNKTRSVGTPEPPSSNSIDTKLVSLSDLFSYADTTDKLLMVLGTIGALTAGLDQPIMILMLGDVLNDFNPSDISDSILDSVRDAALLYVYVGIAVLFAGCLQVACWSITASRQAKRIRGAYVSAILTKEVGWFDVNDPMQLPSRVAETTVKIQEGMGRKVGDGIHFFSTAVAGITIGLVKGWELALVVMALMPFIAFTAFLSMKQLSRATQTGIESYGQAGAIAHESLSNVRTVHAFNSINHFVNKYEEALHASTKAGIKKGFAVGWGTGVMFLTVFCTYALGMFYGAHKVANDQIEDHCTGSGCYDGGRVLTVFMVILVGSMSGGQAAPSAEAVFTARAAAYDVFQTIRRASLIDPLSDKGKKLENVSGRIEIVNVSFAYPSRPHVQVCQSYSLRIEAGETVALVGRSGSGKSTIVSLLERFYDPLSGSVRIDGEDVRTLNVKWLREQVGLVGQEPSLFATSILENIRYGCRSATDEQVIEAAKMANAFDFIKDFPQGFQTQVGERGTQLSGGQKQRIAIARAIIKNPPILLLDEATSALDTESERIVQESLDRLVAGAKRTTIVVAHRLSTIKNASRIAVHSNGAIVEIGSHSELMALPDGHYRKLVEAQGAVEHVHDEEEIDKEHDAYSRQSTLPARKSASMQNRVRDIPEEEDLPNVDASRIWKLAAPEWKFMLAGSLGAIINAAIYPVWGVIMSKITVLYFDTTQTKHDMIYDARMWSLGFVALGLLFAVSSSIQHYSFAVSSEKLVARVRGMTYSAMLHQEIGWFDLAENSSGSLVSRLATDSATLQAMTAETLNRGLVNVTTMILTLAVTFYYSWQMTLILLGAAPVLAFSFQLQNQAIQGGAGDKEHNDADASAGSLLAEAIGSIRTVASFGMEKTLTDQHAEFVDTSKQTDVKFGVVGGVAYGISLGAMFFVLALVFYVSSHWISSGVVSFEDMFAVLMVFSISSFSAGSAAQGATDSVKAKQSAQRVFKIIDRKPEIDTTSASGQTLERVDGDLAFHKLKFAYPSRPEAQIYHDYTLSIARGQTVALVGASGSGKSTAISLLERFYDPSAGVVTLDGRDLRELNVTWLRERISLVSQEPVLFAGTIVENIALGKPGATRDEVIGAAQQANAHEFIRNFPNGYDTDVGDRGAQLSGGQKQRIAIARAILRDPEVLLLDEATSALDNESERVVQASLDRLMATKQRTTIVVAHRLSTIRNADVIAVTQEGAIVEQGSHDQLMKLPDGIYKRLVVGQTNAQ